MTPMSARLTVVLMIGGIYAAVLAGVGLYVFATESWPLAFGIDLWAIARTTVLASIEGEIYRPYDTTDPHIQTSRETPNIVDDEIRLSERHALCGILLGNESSHLIKQLRGRYRCVFSIALKDFMRNPFTGKFVQDMSQVHVDLSTTRR